MASLFEVRPGRNYYFEPVGATGPDHGFVPLYGRVISVEIRPSDCDAFAQVEEWRDGCPYPQGIKGIGGQPDFWHCTEMMPAEIYERFIKPELTRLHP